MRLPLYNIPRYIDCSGETEDALLLPRGNLGYIQKLLNDCNTFYEITDEREKGIGIDVDFTAELYEEQKEALQALLKSDIGILSAGTGFGKTVTAAALIAKMPFSWKGTLAQYCGRLHRNFAGKEEVVIYDYVDFRVPVFDRMYRNRLKGYKQLGYTIKPVSDSNQNETRPSKLYSTGDYKTDFIQDCLNARKSVVICSPYLSKTEVQKFLPLVSKIFSCGCKIFITTRVYEDEERRKKQQLYIDMLEIAGAVVSGKENITQRLAVFDAKILWYGSINFLGYSEKEDCSIRICNAEIASSVEAEMMK